MTLARIKAKFKEVTPLNLHGAYSNETELRIPSIKGALRYWYRAARPGYQTSIYHDITNEEWLFGGARGKAGQSAFLMRMAKKSKDRFNRMEFELEFLLRPLPADKVTPDWKGLLSSIWLLGHLGGLGSRIRRGYGTIALEQWDVEGNQAIREMMKELPIAHGATSQAEWEQLLMKGWQRILKDGYRGTKAKQKHLILDSQSALYIDRNGTDKEEIALYNGISLIQEFRSDHPRDGMIFGAPMKTAGGKIVPKGFNRLPSLIWLRVFRIGNRYYPAFLFLSSSCFPHLERQISKKKRQPYPMDADRAIQVFKERLKKENRYREVWG